MKFQTLKRNIDNSTLGYTQHILIDDSNPRVRLDISGRRLGGHW